MGASVTWRRCWGAGVGRVKCGLLPLASALAILFILVVFCLLSDRADIISKCRILPASLINGLKWENLLEFARSTGEMLTISKIREGFKTGLASLKNLDWLYWAVLFIPFNITYVTYKEKSYFLYKTVERLKEHNAMKKKIIKWQLSVSLDLEESLSELRAENQSLQNLLETYKKQTVAPKKRVEKIEQCDKDLNLKRNKSDSAIGEMVSEKPPTPEGKPRPKTEEGKSCHNEDQRSIRAEKSRDLLRMRIGDFKKEGLPLNRPGGDASPMAENLARSKNLRARTVPEVGDHTSKLPQPDDIRRRYLARKDHSKTKFTLKKELEEYTLPTSRLQKTRQEIKQKEQPKKQEHPTPQKKEMTRSQIQLPVTQMTNYTTTEELVATLDLSPMGRPTSYTEVIRRKVRMPSAGMAPEITIEGKQRWSF